MSIYKSPKSRFWQYDFQFNGTRFHGSTGCPSKSDARLYEAKRRREVALDEDKLPGITLDDACQAYWQDKAQHQRNSKTVDYQLRNLCAIIGKDKMLGAVTQKDFIGFVAKRRATVKPASINREIELAGRVWSHARAAGHAVPLPGSDRAINWRKLKDKEPKERSRELLPDEERRLFDQLRASNPDLAAVVEFAMLSGQRRESVITMRTDKVDLDGKRATVTIKGRSEHTFPLTARMVEIIEAQPGCDGFVFSYVCKRPAPLRKGRPPRLKGRRYPFSLQGWTREWRQARTDAGITNFRFHDLRHTAATRLLRRSGNLKAVQKLLAHTEIQTTARYAHVLEDDLRAAMESGDQQQHSPGQRSTDSSENGSIQPVSEDME